MPQDHTHARPPRRVRTTSRWGLPRSRPVLALSVLAVVGLLVTAGSPSLITIRKGDTLWDLARTHGTSVSVLKQLNGLDGNGTIYAGRSLRLPGGGGGPVASAAGPARSQGTYVVRSGDTLSHVAVRFATSVRALQSANRLSSTRIRIGQRLTIPGSTSVRAAGGGVQRVPTTNAGRTIPTSVQRSVAQNRATLAARSHPSKATVRRMVADTARRNGVPVSLAVAVAYQESGFQQRVVSGVNAIGVMQVLPSTGAVLSRQQGRGLDLLSTQDNITAGVLLLRQLLRSTGSTDKTLAGYYQGLGSISRKGVLPQTRSYITSIHALQARFRNG